MNERKLLNRKYKNADTGRVKVHSADGSDFYVKRFRGRTVGQLDELRKDRPVIYFKINRYEDYTLQCIQEWINVANELDYDFFFVCDNNKLRYDIIRRCYFKDKNIRFIESMRSELKEVASHLCTPKWLNATYAHLTPFYHAKKNGIRRFWNIDADDTTICAEPKQTAALLKEAEKMSLERGYSAYALDMWRSKTNSVHWSLGVFFVNEITDFVSVFEKEESLAWTKTLEEYDRNFNLDWYMTYLKNTSGIKIGTFYPDNTYFIHWGNFVLNVSGCWVNYWGGVISITPS